VACCAQIGVVAQQSDGSDPASPLQLLLKDVGPMLRAAARQLSDKSPKTRMGMFHVLRTLVGVLPGSVGEHLGMLVPGECLLLGTNLSVAVLQAQPFAASYACLAQKVACDVCRAAYPTSWQLRGGLQHNPDMHSIREQHRRGQWAVASVIVSWSVVCCPMDERVTAAGLSTACHAMARGRPMVSAKV